MVFRAYLVDNVWHVVTQRTKPDGTIEVQEFSVSQEMLRQAVTEMLVGQVTASEARRGKNGD